MHIEQHFRVCLLDIKQFFLLPLSFCAIVVFARVLVVLCKSLVYSYNATTDKGRAHKAATSDWLCK